MTNLNQQILKFDYEQNFKDQDFYVSNSNEHSFSLLNSWPKWEKKFINLIGEKFSPIIFNGTRDQFLDVMKDYDYFFEIKNKIWLLK